MSSPLARNIWITSPPYRGISLSMASTQYSMTPLRSCVARPSIGTGDTVAQGSLHCKEHRELQMPRHNAHKLRHRKQGVQRSVAPSTSVDSSCSNPADDSFKSGRSGRVDWKNRTEERRNRHVWMNCRVIRDRDAPGSNPGPPTI